jgi:hypothetical protein
MAIGKIAPRTGVIGKIVVRPVTETTISSPNYTPKINVAFSDIQDVDVSSPQDGDILIYNAASGKYETKTSATLLELTNIDAGLF